MAAHTRTTRRGLRTRHTQIRRVTRSAFPGQNVVALERPSGSSGSATAACCDSCGRVANTARPARLGEHGQGVVARRGLGDLTLELVRGVYSYLAPGRRFGSPGPLLRLRLTCAMPQAGESESEVSEGRAASQLVSAEFRHTAASSSVVGGTAQACHVLRSWTVGSSRASPPASPAAVSALVSRASSPSSAWQGLAPVLRRPRERGQLARQPSGHVVVLSVRIDRLLVSADHMSVLVIVCDYPGDRGALIPSTHLLSLLSVVSDSR
jgi:hypothetical protein